MRYSWIFDIVYRLQQNQSAFVNKHIATCNVAIYFIEMRLVIEIIGSVLLCSVEVLAFNAVILVYTYYARFHRFQITFSRA